MDKYDYIESIIVFIRGQTAINFQLKVKFILSTYYETQNKVFEMPDFYGGDDKNDGWVKEDAVFYQLYAPTRLKNSLKNEIQQKFKNDLTGLLEVLKNGKWGGAINEFIFLVNTIDNNLPPDSHGYFDTTSQELMKTYDCEFKFKVVNIDYLEDLLGKVDDVEKLKALSYKLRIANLIDPSAVTEKIMIDLIEEISGKINEKFINNNNFGDINYTRISTPKKIALNDLEDKRKEIENLLLCLDIVEEAVRCINQDILFESKFNRVKEHIINIYVRLSENISSSKLYDTIISEILTHIEHKDSKSIPVKLLVVYIFDKCDIFKKEGDE